MFVTCEGAPPEMRLAENLEDRFGPPPPPLTNMPQNDVESYVFKWGPLLHLSVGPVAKDRDKTPKGRDHVDWDGFVGKGKEHRLTHYYNLLKRRPTNHKYSSL